MNRVVYEENQRFALWVYVLLAVTLGGTYVFSVWQMQRTPEPYHAAPAAVVLGVVLLASAVTLNVLALRVRVRENDLYVQLGFLVPMFWRTVPFAQIREHRVVTYHPIRDAGGWGMRWGRFEGKATTFFNARGDRGVLIETGGRPLVVGSQNPEAFDHAIANCLQAYHRARG